MNLKKSVLVLVLLIAVVFILVIGKGILIPLILAVFIWFLVMEVRKLIGCIPVIGKRMPRWLMNTLSIVSLYGILGFIVNLLAHNIQDISEKLPEYEKNLEHFSADLNAMLGINISDAWSNYISELNFSDILKNMLSSFSDFLGNAFMIALYVLFILLEENVFNNKLLAIAENEHKEAELSATMTRIRHSISQYISLKTLVSTITGVCSFIALLIIGVDSPIFWAFLIFLLNFIPTIGSLIATIFPAIMALLQFGGYEEAIVVLIVVGTIQVLVGNIIEPKIMGNSLNVSSLVVILALSFWGAIWGITGMVLSVPITVILVLLFSQFESTRNIAILLSEKGNLKKDLTEK
ncbi:MAG: AI-2E family transporter [Crocinitomicaceae bacterium]